MGWWFILAWLDAGVPSSAMLYAGDEQRCLQIASEHLDGLESQPSKYIETIYIGCVQGSRPRRM
jgi:hypothetical protein